MGVYVCVNYLSKKSLFTSRFQGQLTGYITEESNSLFSNHSLSIAPHGGMRLLRPLPHARWNFDGVSLVQQPQLLWVPGNKSHGMSTILHYTAPFPILQLSTCFSSSSWDAPWATGDDINVQFRVEHSQHSGQIWAALTVAHCKQKLPLIKVKSNSNVTA